MKLLALSDTHEQERKFTQKILEISDEKGGIDVLVHAGDITGKGDIYRLKAFNDWCAMLVDRELVGEVVATFGNHELRQNSLEDQKATAKDYTLLIDEEIVIDGIKFYGCPWTRKFYNWQFMIENDPQAVAIYDKIPLDTDVLIVHGPPYGILDSVDRPLCGGGIGTENTGCRVILDYVKKIKPAYYVCGHIHLQNNIYKMECGTTVINAAILDDDYKVAFEPRYFELNK